MIGNRALAPRMVGRRAQLRDLEAYLQLVRDGAGQVVFVAGDAGVGKTRLIREFVARARANGDVELLEGRCYDESPTEPYGPFVDAIRLAVREHGPQAIAQDCDEWAGDLARLVPELEVLAPPARATDDPQVQKRRLFEAIYWVTRPRDPHASRIVVLEDFHWSDQTSHELVRHLARVIARDRILLIVSFRSDELHRRHPLTHLIAQLSRERQYDEIRLSPLSHEDLGRMLEATLDRPLPASLVETLYDRTGGNPFFVEEILKALIEHDRLDALIQAAQQGRSIAQLALPISIKDTILSRTADLDPATAEVLVYAAVIGRRFDFDLLLKLTGLAEGALVRAIERLVERQLVVEELGEREDRYSFRHALTREAVYGDLLGRERRIKHREVLAALEELYRDNRDDAVDQLAYHSLQARELLKAADYTRLAGDRAASMYAYREAIAHYEAALDLMEGDDPRQRADLFDKLAHAAYPLSDITLSSRYWREAQRLYQQAGNSRKVGDIYRWLGRLAWECGDSEAAFAHTRTALELLEAAPASRELAMAYSALSQLYMVSDQPQQSIEWGECALGLAEQLGDEGVRTHALNNVGVSLVELGQIERGLASLELSLELARQEHLSLDEIRAGLNLGGMLCALGDFQRAAQLLSAALALADQSRIELHTTMILEKLAFAEMELGRWDQAHALLDRALKPGERSSPHVGNVLVKGELLRRQGQLEEARQLIEAALPECELAGNSASLIWELSILARVWQALGETDQAIAAVDRSMNLWRASTLFCKAEKILGDGVDLCLLVGRDDLAREVLAALTAVRERAGSPLTLARLDDALGLIAAHEGRNDDAAAAFGQAIERWHAIGLPYQEATSRHRLAACLLQAGDSALDGQARRELATARAIFEALGAPLDLAAVDATARRHGPSSGAAGQRRLTPRERQVIALIAQGYSNRAIAEALVISEKTAEIHVSNILGKLGFTSRAQAAAYAVAQNMAA